jgi:hypothetical protein
VKCNAFGAFGGDPDGVTIFVGSDFAATGDDTPTIDRISATNGIVHLRFFVTVSLPSVSR